MSKLHLFHVLQMMESTFVLLIGMAMLLFILLLLITETDLYLLKIEEVELVLILHGYLLLEVGQIDGNGNLMAVILVLNFKMVKEQSLEVVLRNYTIYV